MMKSFKSSFLYSIYKKVADKYLYYKRKPYFKLLSQKIRPTTSIISSNCFAGRIMQDLGMQYNSPTLGLYFFAPEYIKFLQNLKYYLTESKLVFLEKSRYDLGNQRREHSSHWYPIGLLTDDQEGVEVEFLHYHSEQEAAEKWYRRTSRINWNDIIIIGMEQNLCTEKEIQYFDKLSFANKIFFSTREIDTHSNVKISEFRNNTEVGDPYKKGHIFYKYLIRCLEKI